MCFQTLYLKTILATLGIYQSLNKEKPHIPYEKAFSLLANAYFLLYTIFWLKIC